MFSNDTPYVSCMCLGSNIRVTGKINITGDEIAIWWKQPWKNWKIPWSEKAHEKLWIFSGHPVTDCTFTKIHKKFFCLIISQGMSISMEYKNGQKSVIFQIFLLIEGLRKR